MEIKLKKLRIKNRKTDEKFNERLKRHEDVKDI